MIDDIVWRPDDARLERSVTRRFMAANDIDQIADLHQRAVDEPEWFWDAVVNWLEIPFSTPYTTIRDSSAGIEWSKWFTGGQINLSEVCVDRWAAGTPDRLAIIGEREDGTSTSLTFGQLADQVGRCCSAIQQLGVRPGDAVGVYLPMSPEAIIAFLAVARAGAIFIPIFSGYGAEAVAARLLDPRPALLICGDGFTRRGRLVPMKETADQAVAIAKSDGLQIMVVEYAGRTDTPNTPGRDIDWSVALAGTEPAGAVSTASEDPVVLAYTSGTTGRPKGAIHVHGGFTVKVVQEGAFQTDIQPDDRVMWLTDMGWIMGPWITVAGLGNGATVVTFDGAPDHPGVDRVWSIVEKHGVTMLGLSPTFVRAIQPHGSSVATAHDLSTLRTFASTGEPWNPDPWMWLFDEVGGGDRPIINISGGTEIGACILSVEMLQGIKPASLGMPSLGMAAEVLDPDGRPLRGAVGELAVMDAWPGMTRGFWGEPSRYLDTYWRRIPGVWMHGDWASIDEDGFWFLHGRSDDTLNIAGKRVGPAEIESAAVALDDVVMAAAIGVPDDVKGETVVVYVVPTSGADRAELSTAVANAVTEALGKAFRPRSVVVVDDLPRTRSAKIMRRVIRSLTLGHEVGDLTSLENPDSLQQITRLD